MSTKYIAEKMTRKALSDIFQLLQGAQKYTSTEVVTILGSKHSPTLIKKTLYRLRRQRYIQGGAYIGYELTTKGESRLGMLKFEMIEQAEEWDGIWRIVIYDIPEESKVARNTVRRLIKRLGFVQLQKSVWAHPLPCLEQFVQIRDAYNVQDHLLLLETPHTEAHAELFKQFQKIYPNLSY